MFLGDFVLWDYVLGDFVLGKPSKNKNYDYSDIVPISYDPLPPEGDRDSKNRDNFDEIGPPSLPAVVGTYKLKIRCLDFDTLYIG